MGEVLITDDPQADTTGYYRILPDTTGSCTSSHPSGHIRMSWRKTHPFNAGVPEEADGAALEQAVRIAKEMMGAKPETRLSFQIMWVGLYEWLRE